MRVALVSPYSWTYPGGVTRHIEALAEELLGTGHDVRVLAPHDPDDRLARLWHRGARPAARALPDYVVPLGRTLGFPSNGAVSNVSASPDALTRLHHELRGGAYDVVHLHEPVAPTLCWDALTSARSPLVGTFHCYSEHPLPHAIANAIGARRRLNRLHVRIAVSEAAAWTGRRFFGGRYRVIPNGVALPAQPLAAPEADGPLRIVFVGQAVERKGLPMLLRAFEALREHEPTTLTVIGADEHEVAPLLHDATGVQVLGKASDEVKRARLAEADLLCAPSLGGESFGMVLTEAFAQGTPVVASDIAGYRDVVRHGVDGLLVPRADPVALAEALRDLALDRPRLGAMGVAARERAGRYAWPRVAADVALAYQDAVAVPAPEGALTRARVRLGAVPADGAPRSPARRLPSLEPAPAGRPRSAPALRFARRAGLAGAALLGLVLSWVAVQRVGLDSLGRTLVQSSPTWVVVALALMCGSMVLRAWAWHAILRAALPGVRVRAADALQGTMIGVLMSATLPARLGEPSRALIVARRLGGAREHLPAVLGTLVAQTLLNIVALIVLGAVMFSTVGLFAGRQSALLLYALAPLVVLFAVVAAPALLRGGRQARSARLVRAVSEAREALTRVRSGLRVFRRPRLGAQATALQLSAWAVQWFSCYLLLVALGLDARAGIGAAAAVLFAVNVTAVLPLTPSNLGVFQAACVAVLTGGYGIGAADALGYGIVLQSVELATAVIMGAPALVKEGLSWREVRLRALHSTPVRLSARPGTGAWDAVD